MLHSSGRAKQGNFCRLSTTQLYVRVRHERVSAMGKQQRFIFSVAFAATFLGGCVINPVTGDRELALVSADQEIAIGEQQYAPSQQMQGGSYELDPQLTA